MSQIDIYVEADDDPSQKVKEAVEKLKGSGDYLYVRVSGGLRKVEATINVMRNIPQCVPRVRRLILSDNNLSEFPMSVLLFLNLEGLYLWDNQLTTLPSEILKLEKLKWLSLQSNRLCAVTAEVGQLKHLEDLVVYGELCVGVWRSEGDVDLCFRESS